MNQLIQYLKNDIDRHDKSIRQLARDIGVSHTTVTDIINGKTRAGAKFFQALSDFTHIEFESLVELQDASLDDPPVDIQYREDWLSDFDRALIKNFSYLSESKQREILDWMQRMIDEDSEQSDLD